MVSGSAYVEWLNPNKAELVEIEPVDEHIDRAHRVVLSHVVLEQRRSFHTAWARSRLSRRSKM
jgi:hypothetical protein